MTRDYRVQFWGAVLGGPPLAVVVALGVGIHRHRTRRTHR